MKKKTKALLFALSIGATSVSAQEIAAADRFGHGQDSIECLQNISMYSEHFKAKNYAEADRIRDELKARGIEIIDTPQGAKWRKV